MIRPCAGAPTFDILPAIVFGILAVAGCAHAVRHGPPVALPVGEPRTECEREGWVELVPAEYFPSTLPARSKSYGGLGVFRLNAPTPEDLDDVFARMDEPALQTQHEARTAAADAATRRFWAWILGGAAGMTLGLGTGALLNDSHHTAATVASISGLALGLIGLVGALVVMPSNDAYLDAEARHRLFFDGEQDPAAVARGINRVNERTRQGCAPADLPAR
jgi:hypothetical protein